LFFPPLVKKTNASSPLVVANWGPLINVGVLTIMSSYERFVILCQSSVSSSHVDAPQTDNVFLTITCTIHAVVFAVMTCPPAVNTSLESGVDVALVAKKIYSVHNHNLWHWSCLYAPGSGQVESALALLEGGEKPPLQGFVVRIVGKLQIVDARHDAGEVVVRRIRRLARLAHHGKHGCQLLEACVGVSACCTGESIHGLRTSNGKLRAASRELQEFATLDGSELTHGPEQVSDALAVHVEPVVGLDRVQKG
jgi:hypothetical protein